MVTDHARLVVTPTVPKGQPDVTGLGYAVLPLTAAVVSYVMAEDVNPAFSTTVTGTPEAHVTVGVGDVLNMTIFESESGGLFLPADAGSRPGNFVQLPTQQVDKSGMISVPFGGLIRAAGLTPAQIQTEVQKRLGGRALEPQVIVSVSDRRSAGISVLGDVAQPLQFSIDPGGIQILAAIARAGGSKYPGYESMVVLQRQGVKERAVLSDLVHDTSDNIQLQPGDVVYISHEPRYFTAFGATGQATTLGPINRRFSFDDAKLTLADALAKAGGLEDDRADPSSVFLYRTEPKSLLQAIGATVPASLPDRVPTIYHVDLRDPAGFFLATKFPMHNEDLLFVSNSPYTDVLKVLNLIEPIASSANSLSQARK
jgi:polysaccharide export outer membrane protein